MDDKELRLQQGGDNEKYERKKRTWLNIFLVKKCLFSWSSSFKALGELHGLGLSCRMDTMEEEHTFFVGNAERDCTTGRYSKWLY